MYQSGLLIVRQCGEVALIKLAPELLGRTAQGARLRPPRMQVPLQIAQAVPLTPKVQNESAVLQLTGLQQSAKSSARREGQWTLTAAFPLVRTAEQVEG